MIGKIRHLAMVVLVLALTCGSAFGKEVQEPKSDLYFELSTQAKIWYQAWKGMGVIQPTHLAIVTLKNDRSRELMSPDEAVWKAAIKDTSRRQQEFWSQKHAYREYDEEGRLYMS